MLSRSLEGPPTHDRLGRRPMAANRYRRFAAKAAAVLALLALATPTVQAADGDRWTARACGLFLNTSGNPASAAESGSTHKLTFDDDYGVGLKFGMDLALGDSGWVFAADARYLSTILETEGETSDIEINPVILSVGVGYRF